MPNRVLTGQCLCGAIRFELHSPFRDILVCHCRQCARWTGYALAATAVGMDRFMLLSGADQLKWYASSNCADRGFCATCGSSLFWKPRDGSRVAVLAGSLDPPTGLAIGAHIFVSGKSDYYEIEGEAPRFHESAGEWASPPST